MPSATETLIAAALGGLGVGKVVARGVFTVAVGACAWVENHGFTAADPTYVGVGEYTVVLSAPRPSALSFVSASGNGVTGWQDGPPAAGITITIKANTFEGAPSNPAGWALGAVLGAPLSVDPIVVVLLVVDFS